MIFKGAWTLGESRAAMMNIKWYGQNIAVNPQCCVIPDTFRLCLTLTNKDGRGGGEGEGEDTFIILKENFPEMTQSPGRK